MISEDVWKEFVAKRMDTSFQEKSLKNKERASHSKYPYRGSRKGYARLEQEMVIKELGSNVSNIHCQELWKHAHVNKAGEIENEDVKQVWNKCVILSQTIQSEEMSNARSNILAQALCVLEYSGRVRATGFGVSHKDYFPPKKRYTQQYHDALTTQKKDVAERMPQMENEINSLRKKDTSNNIEEPDIGDTLHGRSLPNGHVKVNVDIALEPNVSLPIPNADDDIMTIRQAIGTFVAWPINLLQVVDADSALSKKKKINNANQSVAPKRKCQGKMIVQHIPRKVIHPNLPQWCNYLSSYMKLKPTESLSPIEIEKDIFGLDEHKEIINAEIIGEIIDYAWLGATTISIYIGQHWVLLGINLKMEIIYYLDPLAKDINMRQDLKKLFDMVIQIYRAQRGFMVSKSKLSNIKWTPIKCPKQSNDHDCGYYICRYMKEIFTYYEGGTIPIDYFPSCRCQQFSNNQIIEVKEDWCFYLISKCLQVSSEG
ncbi:putative transposase [Vigna unguiculata]|uniref:Putative transposase n=1 Tax=Vigna unguiculata TaxID=3917 RepID=A0A4D6MVB9_VIGUN|nr:putative transposase [Vigna unguiculata]